VIEYELDIELLAKDAETTLPAKELVIEYELDIELLAKELLKLYELVIEYELDIELLAKEPDKAKREYDDVTEFDAVPKSDPVNEPERDAVP
jgi:hypothetical protein